MTKAIILIICLTLTVLTGGGWAEEPTLGIESLPAEWVDSPIVFNDPTEDLSVSVDEIIEVLEKARPYIWNELPQSTTLEFDPCTIDPICMAQRQVERMRERKALREKIDRILKVLK